MRALRSPCRVLALFACSWATALPATAQTAVGDGRALDADRRVGGDGRVEATPQEDFRLRNLLVTNSVAGGRGFRGALGYTAPEDFRGRLGSNDLYAFERRASAYSSLGAIVGAMGNTPLNLGQELGLVERRRAGLGETLGTLNRRADDRARDIALAESWFQGVLLSHQSAAMRSMGDAPYQMLGQFQTRDGSVMNITATSLQGIQSTPAGMDPRMIGLSSYERARMIQEGISGSGTLLPGRAWQPPFEDLRITDGRVAGALVDHRINMAIPPGYSDMVSGMATQAGSADPAKAGAALQTTLQQLRDMLDAEETIEQPPVDPSFPVAPQGETAPAEPTEPIHGAVGQPAPPKRVTPTPESIALLRHGRALDDLVADDAVGRFGEIMTEAERLLRRGEYLSAERQFIRALRYMPNHPTAMAGLVNAQVGAGVIGAAGASIRNLFAHHPEMIDVVYTGDLLPSADRLRDLAASIQTRGEQGRWTAAQALTLAFLGRQVGDRALMEQGLKRLSEVSPGDALTGILRRVWLEASPPSQAPVGGAQPSDGR